MVCMHHYAEWTEVHQQRFVMETTFISQQLLSSIEGRGGGKGSALVDWRLRCRAARICWRWSDPSPPDPPTHNGDLEAACTLNASEREMLMLLNSCPPPRCRSLYETPRSHAPLGAFSRRRGGCRSCRSLWRCSSMACRWCGRACASFGRWSWQTVCRSRGSRTQTASPLGKNASYESL